MSQFSIKTSNADLQPGVIVSIRSGLLNKYWSCKVDNEYNPIVVVNDSIDQSAQFTLDIFAQNQVALRACNGKYLSRINFGDGLNPVCAAKSELDVFCKFTLGVLTDGQFTLSADTGLFLSVVLQDEYVIQADKADVDEWCIFAV